MSSSSDWGDFQWQKKDAWQDPNLILSIYWSIGKIISDGDNNVYGR